MTQLPWVVAATLAIMIVEIVIAFTLARRRLSDKKHGSSISDRRFVGIAQSAKIVQLIDRPRRSPERLSCHRFSFARFGVDHRDHYDWKCFFYNPTSRKGRILAFEGSLFLSVYAQPIPLLRRAVLSLLHRSVVLIGPLGRCHLSEHAVSPRVQR